MGALKWVIWPWISAKRLISTGRGSNDRSIVQRRICDRGSSERLITVGCGSNDQTAVNHLILSFPASLFEVIHETDRRFTFWGVLKHLFLIPFPFSLCSFLIVMTLLNVYFNMDLSFYVQLYIYNTWIIPPPSSLNKSIHLCTIVSYNIIPPSCTVDFLLNC